jgi:hypothetical protein
VWEVVEFNGFVFGGLGHFIGLYQVGGGGRGGDWEGFKGVVIVEGRNPYLGNGKDTQ